MSERLDELLNKNCKDCGKTSKSSVSGAWIDDYFLCGDCLMDRAIEFEAAKDEIAVLGWMVEAMAIKLDESHVECPWKKKITDCDCQLRNHTAKNCIECFKKNYRSEAEKALPKCDCHKPATRWEPEAEKGGDAE